jgi:hypothetical protein
MGTGYRDVTRLPIQDGDFVVGRWEENRIGTFRGWRGEKARYGGTAFGVEGTAPIVGYDGYRLLLVEIMKFFETGVAPVSPEETIELFAFMEAADESKRRGYVPVAVANVLAEAEADAKVKALTRIFISSVERLLCTAAGPTRAGDRPSVARPRLGAVSFLHRFGSALNHHVHLRARPTASSCQPVTGRRPSCGQAACRSQLPARPITQADLATLTEKVRRRVVRWFRMQRLLDADAAADMLRWENSGFSVDASVRITLIVSNCVSIVSLSSTCCDTVPGRPSR